MTVVEDKQGLGQINFNVLGTNISIPIKVRVKGRFIPAFTIDPTKPSKGGSIIDLLQPKIDVLVGNYAYEIDTKGNVKPIDPRVFQYPTLLDRISEMGFIPTLAILGGIGYLIYKGIKK